MGLDGRGAIDPEVAVFVARVQRDFARHPDLARMSFAEQRAVAESVRAPWRQGGPVMLRTWELTAPTEAGDVRLRLFDPGRPAGPAPVLIYLHGGGFTTFSLDTHDRLMREYAARAGLLVIGVDYALSPEARFPTALNQVAGVLEHLLGGAEACVDPRRVAVGGDSAGANLAVAACLALRDKGAALRPAAMLCNYGFFDADFTTASQRRWGDPGAMLTREELAGFLDNYLGRGWSAPGPLALPALADDLSNLPPSFHVIAECDPLADGDVAMARRLREAGNVCDSVIYAGATHSFLEAVSISALAGRALGDGAAWLRRTLAAVPAV
ncbi:alpha/beta hydrolase fold domain-containing protein [Caulobacter sp. KR2-114]|uniref:alpha/beta hydrolase fold domain-containing protein n=1 Tax=Caulobacter sp. KR2-114 TaxID=3400912 RepID=UPI003C1056D9